MKAEQSKSRLGPVCFSTPLFSAAFGVLAVVLQRYFFPAELDRLMLASGVLLGAIVGFGLGVAWEANVLPRDRISQAWLGIWPYTWRCLLGLLMLGAVFAGFRLFERYQARRIAALVFRAGGEQSADMHFLQLSGKRVTDANLEFVRSLADTEFLSIYGTSVRGPGLANISEWKGLRQIQLANSPIGDEGLAHLKGLHNLEQLELQTITISDDGLRNLNGMNRLRELRLVATPISDAGLRHLKSLKSLRFLDLEGTKVTSAGVKDLQRALPKCSIVWGDLSAPKGGDGKLLKAVHGAE